MSRAAARSCGRNAAQKNAIVIDRFFESREAALSWERSHPHFMTVQVLPPGSHAQSAESAASVDIKDSALKTPPKLNAPTALPKFDAGRVRLGLPLNSILQTSTRRT